MAAATDMLCIMNDVYTEQTEFCGKKLKKEYARYFKDVNKQMLVVYNEQMIEYIVPLIQNNDFEGKIKVYVYSPSYDPFSEEWESVTDKVEFCALPYAIYNAYKQVIKPQTPTLVNGEDEENEELENQMPTEE